MAGLVALTRPVSAAMTRCELSHIPRVPIDLTEARQQHAAYCAALRAAGCTVVALPPADDLPDSVFIEDTAIVLDEIAVATRPGAAARRGEVAPVADALSTHRPLARLTAPATLDGGDVLRIGRTLFVGASGRTNAEGITQLRAVAAPLGYDVTAVAVRGCLHLKTAATFLQPDLLLVRSEWLDADVFGSLRVIEVAAEEPFAANALQVGDCVIYPAAFPQTAARLGAAGLDVVRVDVSELAKAEGGVTCCSLVFRD